MNKLFTAAISVAIIATLVAAWGYLVAVDTLEASYVLQGITAQEQCTKVRTLNCERKQVRSWERAHHQGAHVRTTAGWVHVTYLAGGQSITTYGDGSAITTWGTKYPAAQKKGDYTFF